MLQPIVRASSTHRTLVLLLTFAIALFGIFSFTQTPIEAFPDVTNLQVNVITQAPGLAPAEIERQVTIPLERSLNGIPGARLMRSESLFGLSLIWIVFDDDADAFRSRTYVMERLMAADLADGIQPEIAPDYTPLGKVLHYRVQSDQRDPTELRSLQATTIERTLRAVPGVADVIGFGGFSKEIHIEVLPENLHRYHLSLIDIEEAIAASNLNVGGGVLRQGDQEYVIRSVGAIQSIDDLRAVVIRADATSVLTLEDVASIWQGHTPRRGTVSANYDDEIVEGIVLMRRGENPNRLLKQLHDTIEELNGNLLPADVHLEILYDRSVMLERTLQTVFTNLWHGAVLIIAVCWLFLRILRGAWIVTAIIPLSLLTAFIGLYAIGLPANLISMGAIDFGILVDGAVVLVENVQHRLRHYRPSTREELRAIVRDSAIEVARPTFFALSIIIAAMLPLFALESVEGRMFRPLALTYVFALIGALIFSLTTVPALCALVLKPSDADVREPAFVTKLQQIYRKALRTVFARPWIAISAASALLVAAILLGRGLGSEFLPELDEGDIYVFAEAPTSISLESAAVNIAQMRAILLAFDEVELVLAEQGRPEDGTDNEGPNLAKIFVRLTPRDSWPKGQTKEMLIARMRDELHAIPGVNYNFSQPIKDSVEEAVSGVRGSVVLKVRGDDFEQMRQHLLDAKALIATVPGVSDLDLYRDAIAPQLTISLRRDALALHAVELESAQHVIQTALAGSIATALWEGELSVPLRVRLARDARADLESIANLRVPTMRGETIALSAIADIRVQASQTSIPRENNQRYLALKFNIEGRDAGSVVRDAIRIVDTELDELDDVRRSWGGEFENQQRAMGRLTIVVPLALVLVLILLLMAMRSLSSALIVFCTLPFGLAGGVFGLKVAGETFSVSAAVGFIALIGQVSLLGLLMLTALASDVRSHGEDASFDGILDVAMERLRPLLMTALLASLGLLPMAISTGMGSETQRPFAAVIVAGMATTLLSALFLMPLIYLKRWDRSTIRARRHNEGNLQQTISLCAVAIVGFMVAAQPSYAQASTESEIGDPRHPTRLDLGVPTNRPLTAFTRDELEAHLRDHAHWANRSRAETAIRDARTRSARAFNDPVLSWDVAAHVAENDFVDGSQHALTIQWEAPLRRLRAARAERVAREVDLLRATRQQEQSTQLEAVRESWARASIDTAHLEILGASIHEIGQLRTLLEPRVYAGLNTNYELQRIDLLLLQLEQEYAQLQDAILIEGLWLSELLEIDDAIPIPSTGWTPPRDDLRTCIDASTVHPDLHLAQATTAEARANARLQRLERTPTLVLTVGPQFATQAFGVAALGGIAVRVPLSSTGRAAVQEADAHYAHARAQEAWTAHAVETARERELREWERALRALAHYTDHIDPQLHAARSAAQHAYLNERIGFAELLEAITYNLEVGLEKLALMEKLAAQEVQLLRWVQPPNMANEPPVQDP